MSARTLVIVESPAKCSKIQQMLGPGYIVKASFGHLRNIDTKLGLRAIDTRNNFKPTFKVIPAKKKYVTELKKWTKKCKEVIIASDLDREGEAIGFHVAELLSLPPARTKRIVFNEITRSAILKAVQSPRRLCQKLYDAQQARQVLDYLIGFELSPLLWKHVQNKLSAGRCQSVALGLIHDKVQEVAAFAKRSYFSLSAMARPSSSSERQKHTQNFVSSHEYDNESTARGALQALCTQRVTVLEVTLKKSARHPPPPYITSTIQQDCSSQLGLSPKATMSVLQKLYEGGMITYMRTDSTVLSQACLQQVRAHVTKYFGGTARVKARQFRNTGKTNTQEAHECIRPVHISTQELPASKSWSRSAKSVYSLIWKRTVATQMLPIQEDALRITIGVSTSSANTGSKTKGCTLTTCLRRTVDLGYSVVYGAKKIDEISSAVKVWKKGQPVHVTTATCQEKFTQPPSHYTEASLIKDLEKKGIGRPSTFSSIVDTLFRRNYIVKMSQEGEARRVKKLVCKCAQRPSLHAKPTIVVTHDTVKVNGFTNKIVTTAIAARVVDFLRQHFAAVMNDAFTSKMETSLDLIAAGSLKRVSVIHQVYSEFQPKIQHLKALKSLKKDTKKNQSSQGLLTQEALFTLKSTRQPVYVYVGKYGPVIQVGEKDDKRVKFLPLPSNQSIHTVTQQTVLQLLAFPRKLGVDKKAEVTLNYGRYGYYLKRGKVSVTITTPPSQVTLASAVKLLDAKASDKSSSIIKVFQNGQISIRRGNYGPYIMQSTSTKATARTSKPIIRPVPNGVEDPSKLTLKQCVQILSAPRESGAKKKYRKRPSTRKKTKM